MTSVAIHGLLLGVLPNLNGSAPHSATETTISVELARIHTAPPVARPVASQADAKTPATGEKPPRDMPPPPIVSGKKTPYAFNPEKATTAHAAKHIGHAPLSRQTVAPTPILPPQPVRAMAIQQAQAQTSTQESPEIMHQRIRRHLESFKYYPASARRRGIEGEVDVGFTLGRDGTANHITVLQGSGCAMLDQAAMQTVRRAQPFPAGNGTYRFRLKFQRL